MTFVVGSGLENTTPLLADIRSYQLSYRERQYRYLYLLLKVVVSMLFYVFN